MGRREITWFQDGLLLLFLPGPARDRAPRPRDRLSPGASQRDRSAREAGGKGRGGGSGRAAASEMTGPGPFFRTQSRAPIFRPAPDGPSLWPKVVARLGWCSGIWERLLFHGTPDSELAAAVTGLI